MSPSSDPGPPPLSRAVARTDDTALEKYQDIVAVFKSNNGADAKAIRAALGGNKVLMDRFLAVAFSALASDSKILRDASVMSLVQTIKDAAALGLEPMSQDAAIVVYNGQAKLMVQWRGYVKRIRNSREVQDLDCQIVYANDQFHVRLGTDPEIDHVPAMQDRGDYLGAYAWALMPSGKYIIEYMPVADINDIRDRYSNKSSNGPKPWETSWGEMARKTVIRRLAKRLPSAAVDKLLSVENQNDEAIEAVRVSQRAQADELSEVRNLALRAVGALPALEAGDETPAEPDAMQSTGTEERAQEIVAEDDAKVEAFREEAQVDPNVAAAMRLAEEQEQLRRQRARR